MTYEEAVEVIREGAKREIRFATPGSPHPAAVLQALCVVVLTLDDEARAERGL
jgi:hypothetical protein